ncbi:MAG: proline-rich domain-containing protein [Bacillota bacterium]
MKIGAKNRAGLIVERGDGWAIVLTRGGSFRRIALSGMEPGVGEEVRIPGNPLVARLALVAAMIALVFLVVNAPFGISDEVSAAAYLGVDVNPSWELALDSDGRVVGAVGFDRDSGEALDRAGVDEGDDVVVVVRRLLHGYEFGEQEDRALLTLAAAPRPEDVDKAASDEVLDRISYRLDRLSAEVPLRILRIGDPEFRAGAREEGISPGVYALGLLKEEVGAGLESEDEDIISEAVSRILEEAGAGDRVVEAMRRRSEEQPGQGRPIVPPGPDREDEDPGSGAEPPPEKGKREGISPAEPPISPGPPEESGYSVPNGSEKEFAPPGWQRRKDGTFTPPGKAGRR